MRKEVKLGDICNILNGYAFKSKEYVEDGIRVIRITNVQKGNIEDNDPKYYDISKIKELKNYILKENDLLISLTGNVGRVGLLPKKLLPAGLNQRVGCLRIKDEKNVSIEYLYQYFNSYNFERDCINNSKGIAQKNLSTEWLKNYKMSIPNLDEQNRIVKELRQIQKLKKLKEQQLKELNQLIKSQFVEMFGDIKNSKFDIKSIKSLVDTNIIKTKKKYKKSDIIKYVDISSINNLKNEIISYKEYEVGLEPSRAQQCLEKADILISTVRPNLKNIAVNNYEEDNIVVSSGFCVLRVNKCMKEYLFEVVKTEKFTNDMILLATGANYPAIRDKDILDYKIAVPPITLQNQVSEIVKQIDKQKFESMIQLKMMEKIYNIINDRRRYV